jgi:signal peptidase I
MSAAPAPGHRQRAALRFLWFVVVPAAVAVLGARFTLPDPGRSAGWGAAARLFVESPLLVAVALFLLLAGLARYWRHHLPGGRWLSPPAAVVPDSAAPPVPRAAVRQAVGLVATVGLAAAAALLMRGSVVESFRVSSASMLPTLLPFDRVVASKLAYGLKLPLVTGRLAGKPPRRGDVVVFRPPESSGPRAPSEVVKRVIGLPGDRIAMQNGHPVINGWRVPSCDAGGYAYPTTDGGTRGRLVVEFLDDQAYLTVHSGPRRELPAGYVVKPGEVFVLGDNRHQSVDSRNWGFGSGRGVPLDRLDGRLTRVFGSDRNGDTDWGRFGVSPGLDVTLPGTDTAALKAGVERCLRERPSQTRPPAQPSPAAPTAPARQIVGG